MLLAMFVLSNRANREFVQMVKGGGDPAEADLVAEVLSEIEGAGAIAALEPSM